MLKNIKGYFINFYMWFNADIRFFSLCGSHLWFSPFTSFKGRKSAWHYIWNDSVHIKHDRSKFGAFTTKPTIHLNFVRHLPRCVFFVLILFISHGNNICLTAGGLVVVSGEQRVRAAQDNLCERSKELEHKYKRFNNLGVARTGRDANSLEYLGNDGDFAMTGTSAKDEMQLNIVRLHFSQM